MASLIHSVKSPKQPLMCWQKPRLHSCGNYSVPNVKTPTVKHASLKRIGSVRSVYKEIYFILLHVNILIVTEHMGCGSSSQPLRKGKPIIYFWSLALLKRLKPFRFLNFRVLFWWMWYFHWVRHTWHLYPMSCNFSSKVIKR